MVDIMGLLKISKVDFHAGDRGSNPLGDAIYSIKGLQETVSPFLLSIFCRPHHYPHHKKGTIQGKLFCAVSQI